MRKIFKLVISTFILACTANSLTPAYAYTIPNGVRVGIEYKYKEVDTVPIGNTNIEIGTVYKDEFRGEAELSSKNGFSILMPSGSAVNANEFYATYEEALNACDDIKKMWGYSAVPVFSERKLWGLYICNLSNSDASAISYNLGGNIINSNGLMLLSNGSNIIMAFDGVKPQVAPLDKDYVKIGDRCYRGVIEFGRYTSKKITAVNVVGLEEYLYGVVPSEMPSSWHKEALKAQAVAARSYTVSRLAMKLHSENGYDLCDGTSCQVYIGYTQEKESTNNAINETRGQIAYFNGAPIDAVFFSASGGSTDNAENVWSNPIGYLKAVPEINETGVSTWTRIYTASEMKEILLGKGINIGNIKNVEITAVGAYGRVQEVTITGTNGTKVLKKEETRNIFSNTKEGSLSSRMYTINGRGGIVINASATVFSNENKTSVYVYSAKDASNVNLSDAYVQGSGGKKVSMSDVDYAYGLSRENKLSKIECNNIETPDTVAPPVNSSIGLSGDTADSFVFTGKGSGHGVGMSQYGAKGMAEKGYTYDEILKYYYKGITLE